MSYAVKAGTVEAWWIADSPTPAGCVRFDGEVVIDERGLTKMVWDAGLNNIRQRTPAEQSAYEAALATAESERVTDATDLKAQAQAALDRLTQIVDATPPFTSAQRDAAIQDIARYLRATMRVVKRLV